MEQTQTYANHGRLVPPYHFGVFGVLAINALWRLFGLFRTFGFGSIMELLMAFALLGLFLYSRLFALKAQDRVIRLEERLRMSEVLPDDLRARVPELTENQLIGLRFASDAELSDLVRQVLDERLDDRDAIKRRIKTWRPDTFRV